MCKKRLQRWLEAVVGIPWWLWLTDAAWMGVRYRLGLWILAGIGVTNILAIPLIPLWWWISLLSFVDRLMRAIVSYFYNSMDFESVPVDSIID